MAAGSLTQAENALSEALKKRGTDRGARTLQRERSPYTSVRGPSARQVASLFVQRAERRTAEQVAYLDALSQSEPLLQRAYDLTQEFLTLLRERLEFAERLLPRSTSGQEQGSPP